jgi:hypothetical protein
VGGGGGGGGAKILGHRTVSSFSLGQTRQVFQPGIKLKILIVHSCQLSKPTVAQISFGVGIFRFENAFFSQTGERVSNFSLKRVRNAFQPRSDRVRNANAVLGYFLAVLNMYLCTATCNCLSLCMSACLHVSLAVCLHNYLSTCLYYLPAKLPIKLPACVSALGRHVGIGT